MPREASASDCARMCKIFVKGPAPWCRSEMVIRVIGY